MPFTEFYCQQSIGDNTNSGSTPSPTPAYASVNGNWNASTRVFTPNDSSNPSLVAAVGDWASVYNDGSAETVLVAQIIAVTPVSITLSASASSGTAPTTSTTGRSIKIGGCWKGPFISSFPLNFLTNTARDVSTDQLPRINFKGNFTCSTSVASDKFLMTYQGYTDIPGDLCPGGRPVFDFTSDGANTGFNNTGGSCFFVDLILQNHFQLGNMFGLFGSGSVAIRCLCKSCNQTALNLGTGATAIECEIYDWNKMGNGGLPGFAIASGATAIRCIAHDTSVVAGGFGIGFSVGTNGYGTVIDCVAYRCSGPGFRTGSPNACGRFINCCSYKNSVGFDHDSASGTELLYLENCNAFNNTQHGYANNNSTHNRLTGVMRLCNCASGGNGLGRNNGFNITDIDPIIYPVGYVPWKNPDGGDFTLVHPLARNSGRGIFPSTLFRGYPDVGAARIKGSAGSTQSNLNFDTPRQGVY